MKIKKQLTLIVTLFLFCAGLALLGGIIPETKKVVVPFLALVLLVSIVVLFRNRGHLVFIIRAPKGWEVICPVCTQNSVFLAKDGLCGNCACEPGHITKAHIVNPGGQQYKWEWAQNGANPSAYWEWRGDQLVDPAGYIWKLEKVSA